MPPLQTENVPEDLMAVRNLRRQRDGATAERLGLDQAAEGRSARQSTEPRFMRAKELWGSMLEAARNASAASAGRPRADKCVSQVDVCRREPWRRA